jgi:hypothetical protein
LIARHQARVGQREQELRVIHFELRQLVDLTNLLSDREPGIPQRMKDRAKVALLGVTNRTSEQDQDVEIRERTEMTPAVAAKGNDRRRVPGLWRLVRKTPKRQVDVSGVALERRSSASAARDVVADLPPGLVEERASLWC